MREVFEMVECDRIYIVPNFISEGYFCQQVLPRELRLEGPITRRGEKTICYCDPVGIHPNMTRLLLQRADEVAAGVPRSETSLVIVGHGTNLNDNSTKAIQDQVAHIRDGGYGFAQVIDAYMEEAPFVADWKTLTSAPHVVIVPFFIADGLHSYQDIPVLLGMREETGAALSETGLFHSNPHLLHGRQLYYSGAIGTEPLLAEVILDQVREFDSKHAAEGAALAAPEAGVLTQLGNWLDAGRSEIGEVIIRRVEAGGYTVQHREDAPLQAATHHKPEDAREIARWDAKEGFRPLHSAPTLRRGWRLDLASLAELRLALDFLYPAAVGMLHAQEVGTLTATPLRELLGRQSGMYRFTNTITDDAALKMIADVCANSQCTRRILWPLTPEQPLSGPAACKAAAAQDTGSTLPLLCIEACPRIVTTARKIAREQFEAKAEK